MYLGKAIRLGRLFNRESGRLLAITLDHAIARGVLPGLVGESGGGQDSMKEPTSETRTATVTWSVGEGGLGKQA